MLDRTIMGKGRGWVLEPYAYREDARLSEMASYFAKRISAVAGDRQTDNSKSVKTRIKARNRAVNERNWIAGSGTDNAMRQACQMLALRAKRLRDRDD